MKHLAHITTVLFLISCTKKMPARDPDFISSYPKAFKEAAISELPSTSPKKKVDPPELVRVDEDTLLVKGNDVGMIQGTEVIATSVIDTRESSLISKDDSLFQVKTPLVPEMPVLQVKSSEVDHETGSEVDKEVEKDKDSFVLEFRAEAQTEIKIVAGASENVSENLCLALSGPDAGKFVAYDSAECWINQEEISRSTGIDENSKSTVSITLDSKEALASLEDLPFLTIQVKAYVPEALPTSNTQVVEVVLPASPGETNDLTESLPIVMSELITKETDAITADPNLVAEDLENIHQLKNRVARVTARYLEKKLKHEERSLERKRLRQDRRLNREKIVKVKNAEKRICRRKQLEKCDDLTGVVHELAEKENKKTKEIAELKEQIEGVKNDVLEEIREIHESQSEIKSLGKKSKN